MFYGIIYLNVFLRMRVPALFWVLLCGICAANAASHSLKYFYTAVTAGIDFPEFTTVGLVDDEPFTYYDSNIGRETPKTEWIKENVGADYWDRETQTLIGTQQSFKANIGIAMQRFNQTQGVHSYQRMYGCEWDDETEATGGFNQYGYDGEDFITYDMENQHYVAPAQQAFISAQKWNHIPAQIEGWKQYLTQECVDWLKKYVSYGRSALERTVAPKVSLLQKDPRSPVITCHVTGFYPRGVMVTWQRNGKELDKDVERGETVPNEDGTFQTRSHLTVKPEDGKGQEYTCTVQHKSLEQDMVLPVKEENIKSNRARSFNPDGNPDGSSPLMGIIIGCVVGALILILAVIGVLIWKKRSSGYGKTSNSETDSENSDKTAVSVPDYRKTRNPDMDSENSDKTAVSVPDYRKTRTSDTDYEISDETAVSVPDYRKTSNSDTDFENSDKTAVSVPYYGKTRTLDTDPEISSYCSIDSLDSATPLLRDLRKDCVMHREELEESYSKRIPHTLTRTQSLIRSLSYSLTRTHTPTYTPVF